MTSATVRIATRASQLALWQARHVSSLLEGVHLGLRVEIVEVSTKGDRDQLQPLHQIGGAGVFTREIQAAVLDGRADIAVHSLKDLPTEPASGLTLAAVPERGPTADAIVLPLSATPIASVFDLPPSARVGTGSLRRQAQLLHARGDLQLSPVRGNVETRLRKLDAGEFDAIVLAEAGLSRLGLAERISLLVEPPLMYAAVGQGALGLECRDDDDVTRGHLQSISEPPVFAAVSAERSLMRELRAGCHAPVGAATRWDGGRLSLTAVVLSADGKTRLEATGSSDCDPAELGIAVAQNLLSQGAGPIVRGT